MKQFFTFVNHHDENYSQHYISIAYLEEGPEDLLMNLGH